MVNRGLKQEEVFQAAIEIERQGEEPSAKKIREYLGSGSLTTISKYFKLWQIQRPKIEDTKELDLNTIFKDIDCEVVAEFFSNEHPQITALVFSYLEPRLVAIILKSFSKNLREDVLDRMENLGFVTKQFVQKIAEVISSEFRSLNDYHGEQKGGASFVKKVREEMNR